MDGSHRKTKHAGAGPSPTEKAMEGIVNQLGELQKQLSTLTPGTVDAASAAIRGTARSALAALKRQNTEGAWL